MSADGKRRASKHGAQAALGWGLIGLVALAAMLVLAAWALIPREKIEEFRRDMGLHTAPPERHAVPDEFQGWAVVEYGLAGEPALETEDGVLVFRYPASGPLRTSTDWNSGIKRKDYFSFGEQGRAELARRGGDRRIWGEHDIRFGEDSGDTVVVNRRTSVFFVGTNEEYDQARRRPPHMLPGLMELPVPDAVPESTDESFDD